MGYVCGWQEGMRDVEEECHDMGFGPAPKRGGMGYQHLREGWCLALVLKQVRMEGH